MTAYPVSGKITISEAVQKAIFILAIEDDPGDFGLI